MAESRRVPMTMRDFFFDDPFFSRSWEDFDRVREAMFQESRDMWKRFDEDFRNMACMSNNIMLDSDLRSGKERQSSLEQESSKRRSSSIQRKSSMSKSSRTEESSSSSSSSQKKEVVKSENFSNNSSDRNNDSNWPLDRQDSLARWESGWMFPRRWMLPSLSTEFSKMDLFNEKDSEVIRVKQDDDSLEVSLDTSQYRPDELRVSVANHMVSIEGKHEEKSENGNKMISRQFSRKYSLPRGVKAEDVTSNLSSDGVLVIAAGKAVPALEVKINQN